MWLQKIFRDIGMIISINTFLCFNKKKNKLSYDELHRITFYLLHLQAGESIGQNKLLLGLKVFCNLMSQSR